MSVMLISKREYIKAAGLLAGTRETGKEDLDLYFDFSDLYVINYHVYYERYAPNHLEVKRLKPDIISYYDIFAEYKAIAAEILKTPEKLNTLLSEIGLFLDSVMYQIEDNDYYEKKAVVIVSGILKNIESYLDIKNCNSWGGVDLSSLGIEEKED